jgi:hypothetical protein
MSLTNAEAKNRSTRLGQAFALKRKYLAIPMPSSWCSSSSSRFFSSSATLSPRPTYNGSDGEKVTSSLSRHRGLFLHQLSKWSVLFVSLFIGIQTTMICLVLRLSGRLFPGREEVQRQ